MPDENVDLGFRFTVADFQSCKVRTPQGSYNPHWAVLVEKDGEERLYFVVETNGSLFTENLRDNDSAEIECGKVHFKDLAVGENPAEYVVVRTFDDLMAH